MSLVVSPSAALVTRSWPPHRLRQHHSTRKSHGREGARLQVRQRTLDSYPMDHDREDTCVRLMESRNRQDKVESDVKQASSDSHDQSQLGKRLFDDAVRVVCNTQLSISRGDAALPALLTNGRQQLKQPRPPSYAHSGPTIEGSLIHKKQIPVSGYVREFSAGSCISETGSQQVRVLHSHERSSSVPVEIQATLKRSNAKYHVVNACPTTSASHCTSTTTIYTDYVLLPSTDDAHSTEPLYGSLDVRQKTEQELKREGKPAGFRPSCPQKAWIEETSNPKKPTVSPAPRPDTTPAPRHDTTPAARHDTTPAARPDTTPAARPDTTPAPRHDTTPAARHDTTPAPRHDTTPAAPIIAIPTESSDAKGSQRQEDKQNAQKSDKKAVDGIQDGMLGVDAGHRGRVGSARSVLTSRSKSARKKNWVDNVTITSEESVGQESGKENAEKAVGRRATDKHTPLRQIHAAHTNHAEGLPDFICPSSELKSKEARIRSWMENTNFTWARRSVPLL